MKNLKKTKQCILSLIAMLAFVSCINAQNDPPVVKQPNYHTAIGLRGGGTTGITIKQFFGERNAMEGIFGFWTGGMSATVVYERHEPSTVSGLKWYYGAGAHVAFFDTKVFNSNFEQRYFRDYSGVGIGVDGIVGLEYKILPIPFAISLDVKPFIEFNSTGSIIAAFDPSLGIKFTF